MSARLAIVLGAVAGTVGALAARGAAGASAWALADVGWCAALGLALGLLVTLAGPRTWLLVGALLVPSAWGSGPGTIAAGAVLLAGLAAATEERLRPLTGLVVAAAVPVAVFGLVWPVWTGATSLVAAIAVGALVIGAVPSLSSRGRRALLWTAAMSVVAVLVVGAAATVSMLAERTRLERAADAVQAGLDASRDGDAERAARLLDQASADFDRAGERLDRPWSAAGRALPVFGQQLAALSDLVAVGRDLAAAGARTAAAVDVDRLRPEDGQVDLAAIDALIGPFDLAATALDDARRTAAGIASPWLLGPVRDAADELVERSADASSDIVSARSALAVLPSLLGADGERRWLLLMDTPSELRGAGGYPGDYGVLRADHGRLELEHVGRIGEVSMPAAAALIAARGDPEWLARYGAVWDLDRWTQNSTVSPHFPSGAASIADRYTRLTGAVTDGVIQIDPQAFAALLRVVGPVTVDGWPDAITADSAPTMLLHDQYLAFANQASDDRHDLLADVARAVFDRLVGGGVDRPGDLGAQLSPMLPQRHLQLWSARPAEQAWFAELGATGALSPVRGDALAVIVNNASTSKIDWYLHRTIDYRVDTSGTATLTVQLRNLAPSSGVPAYVIGGPPSGAVDTPGVNGMVVSVFTPLELRSATVDGAPATLYPASREQGRNVVDVFVAVPPGGTQTLVLDLAGPVRSPYRLDLHHQPVVNPDDVRVTVDGDVLFDGPQDRDLVLSRT